MRANLADLSDILTSLGVLEHTINSADDDKPIRIVLGLGQVLIKHLIERVSLKRLMKGNHPSFGFILGSTEENQKMMAVREGRKVPGEVPNL